jgi:hypothetical protein
VRKERGGGSGPTRGYWAGIGSGPTEVRLGCGERRAGPRVRKRKREGKRVWGGFSFKLFSNLFSFLKKSFCKLLKLPNSFQTFKLNYKYFKSFQD